MITDMGKRWEVPLPDRHQYPVIIASALVLVAILCVLINKGIVTGIGLALIFALIAIPFALPEAALFILGFAGRFDLPPLLNGTTDIAFWSACGLVALSVWIIATDVSARDFITVLNPVITTHIALVLLAGLYWFPVRHYIYPSDKTFRILVYGTLMVLLPQVILRNKESFQRFLRVFVFLVTALALISIIMSLSGGLEGLMRISPPGGGPITLARMTGFASIGALGIGLANRNRRLMIALSGFLALATFATGSRAPTLFLIAAVIAFLIGATFNTHTRKVAFQLLIIASAMGIILLAVARELVTAGVPFATRYTLLFAGDKGASVNARTQMLNQALALGRSAFPLGHGTGSWPIITGIGDTLSYPHNIVAEYFVEQGALGLFLFGCAVLTVVLTALNTIRQISDRETAILTIVGLSSYVYALANAMTSGDIYDNRYLWLYAGYIVACQMALKREKRHGETEERKLTKRQKTLLSLRK